MFESLFEHISFPSSKLVNSLNSSLFLKIAFGIY